MTPAMSSMNKWIDRSFKIILIIGFLLLLVILKILLDVGPALSYEFSIYDAYPWYFWVFLLSAIVCGQVVILGSAVTRSVKNYWLFGLFAILISNAVLFFLPIIRGYYIYGDGDALTHIGYMKDILSTSNISDNHYPIDHILGVIIHVFSGLSLPDTAHIIPPIFSFFFILSMYFVGKTIFQNKFEQLILVLLASMLIFGNSYFITFTPNSQALFLVPLMLYLAFKIYHDVNNIKYYILLLLIGSLIVFYHPLVALMVILILGIMEITPYILEKYQKSIQKKVNYSYTIFYMLTLFLIWSSYLITLIWVMKPILGRLIFGDESVRSELQTNFDLLSKVMVDPMYLLKLILNVYGQWVILGFLSLISIGLILKSMKDQKTESSFYKGVSIVGFITFLPLSIAMLFTNGNFDFGRVYCFALLFSLLLIPTGIYLGIYRNPDTRSLSKKKIVILSGVFFIFFCITYFSIFNLYYSPTIKYANQHVPQSDYTGLNTFFSYRDDSLPVLELGPSSFRFYDAIFGVAAERPNIYYYDKIMDPPDHFGYQNETLSRDFYSNLKYLILNNKGRESYPHVYPEFKNDWRYLPEDFEKLKYDNNIQQIYSNRNIEIFMISENGSA